MRRIALMAAASLLALTACGGSPPGKPGNAGPSATSSEKAEKVPAGEPGMAVLGGDDIVEVANGKQPANGKLITPAMSIAVRQVGRTATVKRAATQSSTAPDDAPGVKTGPAPGEVLHALRLTLSVDGAAPEDPVPGSRDHEISGTGLKPRAAATAVKLVSGGRSTDLTATFQRVWPDPKPGEDPGGPEHKTPKQVTLVVSAPENAAPQVEVGYDGVVQLLTLSTGERASTNAAAYYRAGRVATLNKTYEGRTTHGGRPNDEGGNWSAKATLVKATLTPYSRYLGWTSPGKAWLALRVVDRQFRADHNNHPNWPTEKCDKSYVLAAAGATIPCMKDLGYRDDLNGAGAMTFIMFQVPETFTTGTLTVAPSWSWKNVNTYDGYVFPTQKYTITLGQ